MQTQGDYLVIHNVARILELVVPLMEHPSETFLASLEEDLMRLTVKHGQTVQAQIISVTVISIILRRRHLKTCCSTRHTRVSTVSEECVVQ